MQSIHLSGLFVEPITKRIRAWNADGKITEEELENVLTSDARALVDHSMGLADWVPLADVEELLALVAEKLGGETGLVEWAGEIIELWREEASVERLVRAGQPLTDAPGFIVSQATELLLHDADWLYEGGRSTFSVRLRGMRPASPALKSFLGALLARLANAPKHHDFDVRFEGIDGDDLVVFGENLLDDSPEGRSRLHQAALIA